MSLLERLDVPEAKSRASTRPTDRPRGAAAGALPEPTTPPPTTSTSSSASASAASADSRYSGDKKVMSVHVHPIEGPFDGFLPPPIPLLALFIRPRRLPAL